MMKKILFSLAFLVCLVSSAQIKPNFDGVNYTPLTTVEINALTGMLEGDIQYNSTTETLWRYNGTAWADTGSGLSTTDIDTFAELDAIVADKSLVNLEDAQTFTGSNVFSNQSVFDGSVFLSQNTGSIGLSNNTDGSDIKFTTSTALVGDAIFDFVDLTVDRTYTLPDASGTIALTSDITGSSLPVDDTTALVQDPVDNTKQVRIDAGNLPTSTTAVLTIDGNVNLSNVVSAASIYTTDNAILRSDGTVRGTQSSGITISDTDQIFGFEHLVGGDSGWYFGEDTGVSGRRWAMVKSGGTSTEGISFIYQSSDATTYNGAGYTTIATINESGAPSETTDLINKAYADANYGGGTDDQTASEVNITDSGSYYTGTTVEAGLQEVGDSLLVQISSDTTGLANSSVKPIKALYVHDYSVSPTEPTLGTNEYAFQINGPSEEKSFVIPLGAVGADIATGTFVNFVPVHDAITITRVEAHLNTAPTGSVATFDINEDGTSILSTKLTIDATENWSDNAATAAVISDSAINALSVLSVDVDGTGSTIAGADGTITIYYTIDP